jgi:hypothetical protein
VNDEVWLSQESHDASRGFPDEKRKHAQHGASWLQTFQTIAIYPTDLMEL